MAASRPLPSWVLLERIVRDLRFAGDPTAEGWLPVKCETKKSEGCGEYGSLMAEGLTLYARLDDEHPDCSRLSVRADERFQRSKIQEQLDKQTSQAKSYGTDLSDPGEEFLFDGGPAPYTVKGYVEIADKNLMILTAVVSIFSNCAGKYYLVYDAAYASMSMIPYPPDDCYIPYFNSPLLLRNGDEYTLVLIARNLEYQ
ncbi:hypothetical protein E2562_033186 [Oryza meyeriana var. granulata]|uniref:Uncharacterized protein n=1 Tax=Oryza meyeriana var. granulata TaxID=110450 RepID=A0A6G1DRE3_9ORYZ|nr:hypothetical protein E2562_033186 [Oryza meyeriana var. granulata]